MATRLRDIAEKAGVSITTAAHVMRGYTGSRIKQETRDRVIQIATELGYRPNAIARSLKTQQPHAIGIYTGYGYHSLRDPFMAEVYTGIQFACRELHYDFIVHGDIEGKTPDEIRLKLCDGKVTGLVVHAPPDDPVVASLSGGELPAVAIADRQTAMPSLVADDEQGMRLLLDYLWERGHRRILYLTSHVPLASVDARSQTLARLLAERGTEFAIMRFDHEQPTETLQRLLTLPNRPTAVCCWNDYYAYVLIAKCLEAGVRIPDDLAIVGFDGLLERRLPARRLVTVAVPWEEMAAEAVRMIVKQVQGIVLPSVTTFPTTLIPGDTA
ncbi:MAG TPA: LacI family DNA-binding transcriptional regulator [Candidatus Saccharimonadales bacterium]|nr:LacI family DNA-binding transcriptional regulator [Candidatus Saccharimonadales bacterium]